MHRKALVLVLGHSSKNGLRDPVRRIRANSTTDLCADLLAATPGLARGRGGRRRRAGAAAAFCWSVLVLLAAPVTAPVAAQEVAEPIAAVGGMAGWSFRQIAIAKQGGPQTDLAYQAVNFGVSGQLFGVRRWVGVRARVSAELLTSLDVDREDVPVGFEQVSIRTELAPVFTWLFGDVGIHGSAGLAFQHWFRGSDDDETTVVAAQEALSIPLTLGATIDAGGVLISPEVGVGFTVWYASASPSIRASIDDGSASVQGLDLWLSLTVAAPL